MPSIIASLFNDPLLYEQVVKVHIKHETLTFPENEVILTQGDHYSNFFFIKRGSVKIVLNESLISGHPIHTIVSTLSENDIFGEFRLFDDYPASADVVTAVESEIVMIDVDSFRKFLDTDHHMGYKVFREMLNMLVIRLHRSNDTVMSLMTSAIEFQKQLHELFSEK